MDVTLLMKIVGLGILVAIACQILQRTGREEMSLLVSVAGMILILIMLISEMTSLINSVKAVFGL